MKSNNSDLKDYWNKLLLLLFLLWWWHRFDNP